MSVLPKHIAIIMDGNGRWAKQRLLPRVAGHKAGLEVAKNIVRHAGQKNIEILTLFAFSSENWQRPPTEVSFVLGLLTKILKDGIGELHQNKVRLRFIGDYSVFNEDLRNAIQYAENLTQNNTGMTLVIAVNYGGRWDIVQAARNLAEQVKEGALQPEQINENLFSSVCSLGDLPAPDLLIRTSGEQRISNFLLWQMAYTELYFTRTYWPDFSTADFDAALEFYTQRERRFGKTGEQVQGEEGIVALNVMAGT